EDGPDRTASITISDPEHALQFGMKFSEDASGVLWANRLVRIQHQVHVPALGFDVRATVMVGVPTAVSRRGAEIGLELGDKSLLADHGVRPRTFKKGTNVGSVIRFLLRDVCGERHLRIPVTRKRLSKPYTVG